MLMEYLFPLAVRNKEKLIYLLFRCQEKNLYEVHPLNSGEKTE